MPTLRPRRLHLGVLALLRLLTDLSMRFRLVIDLEPRRLGRHHMMSIIHKHRGPIPLLVMCSVDREGRLFEDVVLEVALLLLAICTNHAAKTVLDAVDPLAIVHASIGPDHLALPVALIFDEITFVSVATAPDELAFAVSVVLMIFARVGVAGFSMSLLTPFALSVFHSFVEISGVDLAS